MDIVTTKKTNVMSTPSINCHNIKVRDCYILPTVLLAIILLLIIINFAVIMQNKKVQYKMKNNELKNVRIKNCTCYFNDVIKLEDFDLDILIDEKSQENYLIYGISYKNFNWFKIISNL